MESGRPDDLAVLGINSDQRSTGFQCLAKKGLEDLCFVTIFGWMLFPNERVSSCRIKVMKILCSERLSSRNWPFKMGWRSKGILGCCYHTVDARLFLWRLTYDKDAIPESAGHPDPLSAVAPESEFFLSAQLTRRMASFAIRHVTARMLLTIRPNIIGRVTPQASMTLGVVVRSLRRDARIAR
jgi:hypothetical protein